MLYLRDADEGSGGTLTGANLPAETKINNFVIDSRTATPGSLFLALPGEHTDGHRFIGDAVARGAVAVMARQDRAAETLTAIGSAQTAVILVDDVQDGLQRLATYWRNRHAVTVVGITGSVGKTSTKELTAAVLRQKYPTLKNEKNYNNELGLPLTLLKLEKEHREVVLEIGGAYAFGEITKLAAIARPSLGVVTNVGPVHLERMGTVENIAKTKSELVEALPADGVAILYGDDPLVHAMAKQTKARVFFYGFDPSFDLWANQIESKGMQGIAFTLHYKGEKFRVKLPMLGQHSIQTALAATSVGLNQGMNWTQILAGLRDPDIELRLVLVSGLNGATVIDDTYNSAPASTLAALNLLSEFKGRHIAVLGDMAELGAYAEEGHRKVGTRAAQMCDYLITVGRLAQIIAAAAQESGMKAENIKAFETNEEAVETLKGLLQRGDYVLVKGSRSARMELIVEKIRVNKR